MACFGGGMLGLGAVNGVEEKDLDMQIGGGITKTCYELYHNNPTGIGPEDSRYSNGKFYNGASFYYLRPETVESLFYYWRFTHNQKYRGNSIFVLFFIFYFFVFF